jgi:hypothetical protein
MARYQMDDGTIVDTAIATASWDEATDWDGSNHVSRATGSQWEHQALHRSAKGRYWLESWSDWQGSRPGAEWLTEAEAAAWLMVCGIDLPADLAAAGEAMAE